MPKSPSAIWHQPGTIARFLEAARGTVPLAIEQIDIVLRLIAASRERIETFLNIGCGDGLLAAAMLDEFPKARCLVLDGTEALLDAARPRLRVYESRIEMRVSDFGAAAWTAQATPQAPFDAIICNFAGSPVPNARKRALLAEVFELLKPGGIFLNIEVVASATRWTGSASDDYVIDGIFGDALKAARNKTRAEIAREYYRQAGADVSQPVPLEVQCDWLREIGFESVDCYLKVLELAVFGGQRGGMTKPE